MTNKELFNKIKNHLLTQNAKALNGKSCAYRGESGRMCAAGCLIEDKYYHQDFEGTNVTASDVSNALINSGIKPNQLNLVHQLQVIHDDYEPEEWPKALKEFERDEPLTNDPS